ncbi:biotin carboxylase N-terminal domain-containing protein [Jatrophihabitans sp.]|uniref:acetyl/propionyl/methylcrotonyl-CoA carboxylase subunit alpha n=1 Tax=Jatrophihabitans sp. TaxID=1932789 RepID=UPI0030C753C4|nr:Biotin carboxylase of acetyl-CoA carboxylase / Biotin carboxyl carrier protein of acetyl-CoA [Jatrophihabitans sp.]
MQKVLIANRGEIAVRVIRACRDAGYTSVAIYAEPDRDALHVKMADEAYALGGNTPGESYLVIDKVIDAAKQSGADAIHPGYGFLSENADFAQAVLDAGITWIGPSPQSIRDLGDKAVARHIAERAGAPLVAGTKDPVSGADEVIAFAEEHGLPIAIKAVYGGGGRGMKIAREMSEVAEFYDSAVREAISAFGRGECFVERYLDRSRHVEAQVLADTHGNVIVVGTRDCSLQRRNQKLVEEAPAPYLTDEQRATIHASAKAICKEASYYGAGTVEYLVGADGVISFLEVNTRLQVEHPVTEETSGVDLVREQFRIAEGEVLRFTEDPTPRGHAFEFRINGEDPGRGFLPAPGTVTTYREPAGPGVRVDSGIEGNSVVGGAFDSLLAKLIVTGESRAEALQRARRALDEMIVDGMATALPFHRAVVSDPAFATDDETPFTIFTRWIETEFDNQIPPFSGGADAAEEAGPRETVVVEVGGKRLEVSLPAGFGAGGGGGGGFGARKAAPKRAAGKKSGAAASGDSLTAPMQGTIVKVAVTDGDTVEAGQMIVVLEAMKMEQPINAHKAGVISGLSAEVGAVVTSGSVICEIKE